MNDARAVSEIGDSAPWESAAAILLVLAAPLVLWVPGGRFLLPLLAPLPLYPAFARAVRRQRYGRAWCLGMGWAALFSAAIIVLVQRAPEVAAAGILNGEPYREEMFGWIQAGVGKEVSPARFLPEHALHLGAFALLTWVSAGYLGLVLGALLTAYMSYFVGSYAATTSNVALGAVVGWVPWSVIRVAAFVALGAILTRPLLVGRKWPMEAPERRWLLAGLAGIGLDIGAKIALAPFYGEFLRRFASS